MKRILFAIGFLGVFLFTGCSKDFLNADDQEYLTEKRQKELLELPSQKKEALNAEMRGLYNHIFSYMNSEKRADDERGMTSVLLATDLTGLDIVDGNAAWFRQDYQIANRMASLRRPAFLWNFYYKIITKTNRLLVQYFEEGKEMNPEIQQLNAELHTLRGMSYYYLVNLFQQTYKGNENKPGIPLVLKPGDVGKTRATVSAVYEQIIKDLTYGVEKSQVTTDNRLDLDKAVAATYLARVYAIKEEWTEVAKYADIAIEGQDLTPPSPQEKGFANINSPGVLWGYDVNAQTTLMYASFFSVFDNTVDGYTPNSPKLIYSNLYNKISTTDVRKGWFAPEDPAALEQAVKYYGMISGGSLAAVKFHSPSTFDGDYIYLRMEDAYLMKLEALEALGESEKVKTGLAKFMSYRDKKYDVVSMTNLKDEIRLQRRIELWGEGVSFFDMKRWKVGFDRTVDGTNHLVKKVVPAGDASFVYQIPIKEIEQNPDLGQNP